MTTPEQAPPRQNKPAEKHPSVMFYVLLAAVLLIFIRTFTLLSPILLSLLLIFLITLSVNPVIVRMRSWTGGRKRAAGLLLLGLLGFMGLTGWAFVVPMKDSVSNLTEQLPEYWERIQKPLIKLEQKAADSEEKLQEEVTAEIARENEAAGELPAEDPSEGAPSEPESDQESESGEGTGSVRSGLGDMFGGIMEGFIGVAFNAAQILIVLVTVFFGAIYTLMNPRPIFGAMFSVVPGRHHDKALTIAQRIGDFVPRWAGATLLRMVIIGLLVGGAPAGGHRGYPARRNLSKTFSPRRHRRRLGADVAAGSARKSGCEEMIHIHPPKGPGNRKRETKP